MTQPTLHLIIDPLCGWTYAAAPLMAQSLATSEIIVQVHGGGMLAGSNRRQITADWHDYVRPHDENIASISGQEFGQDYYDKLLSDTTITLDSEPSTVAILAAEELMGEGVTMLNALQRAYFFEGQNIGEQAVLKHLATDAGIAAEHFEASYYLHSQLIASHFEESRQLLNSVGGQGFPSAALEKDGQHVLLNISQFYGKPEQWAAYLENQLA